MELMAAICNRLPDLPAESSVTVDMLLTLIGRPLDEKLRGESGFPVPNAEGLPGTNGVAPANPARLCPAFAEEAGGEFIL